MLTKIDSTTNTNFKAANVNLLVTADNHGNVMTLPRFIKTIENNAKDIFVNSEKKTTANFFAIVGDWFINPSKKGFKTQTNLSNGEIQNLALLKTLDTIKDIVKKVSKNNGSLETLFIPGNHCLDAGDEFIIDVTKKDPMKSVLTNIDCANSPAIVKAMQESDKIVKSIVYSVSDDKDKNLLHKILFVGATIPSMDFYNPGLLNGMEFYDNCNKKDANLNEEDMQGTIKAIKQEVDAFKKENPKGAVILLSHMGGRLSEMVCKNVPQINCVLNGHDHKNCQTNVGKTSVNSLGKDNEMLKSLNFEFDDNGNLIKTSMNPYFTATTLSDGLESHPFQLFLNKFFEKDIQPVLKMKDSTAAQTGTFSKSMRENFLNSFLEKFGIEENKELLKNKNLKNLLKQALRKELANTNFMPQKPELSYGNEIRYSNSYLMNYLTSSIKDVLQSKYDPEIFTVALQSSIVRGGLKSGSNNLDIMKVFDGVSEDLSTLKAGTLKGNELVGLIVENVLSNLKAPTRNTIIHWSDVQVNRSLISDIKDGNSNNQYADAIRVRNPITKEFEPVNLSQDYKMAICEKYLVKDDIEWAPKIKDRFEPLNKTYDELFREHLANENYNINVTERTKEQRIV